MVEHQLGLNFVVRVAVHDLFLQFSRCRSCDPTRSLRHSVEVGAPERTETASNATRAPFLPNS